jgi:hypothetical protein
MVAESMWIELIIISTIPIGFLALIITRLLNYRLEGKSSGLTTGVIRFSSLMLIIPITAVLAIENIISPQSVTAVFGTIIGYVLTGFGD